MTRAQKNSLALALVLGAVLAVALVAWKLFFSAPGLTAVVQQQGREVARLGLDRDDTVTVEGPDGDYNTIQVKDGAVSVIQANCPDLICVRTGRADQAGQVIACLPHGVIIYVEAGQ